MTDQKSKQLEKLLKHKGQLNSRIASVKARIGKEERKKDTRRKILVGAYFLEKFEKDGEMEKLKQMIDPFLSRDNDRKLFGLSVKEKKDKP